METESVAEIERKLERCSKVNQIEMTSHNQKNQKESMADTEMILQKITGPPRQCSK